MTELFVFTLIIFMMEKKKLWWRENVIFSQTDGGGTSHKVSNQLQQLRAHVAIWIYLLISKINSNIAQLCSPPPWLFLQ